MNKENYPLIDSSEVVRPTHLEINLNTVAENYSKIKEHVQSTKVMPILKANAYGHGLIPIAKLMEEIGADYLGVAVLEEALLLRKNGIELPILVMGGILNNQIPLFLKYGITITASSIDKLMQIEEAASSNNFEAKVHLKIDTGMERIGVHYYNAENFIEKAFMCKHIFVEGIFSHFANSELMDLTYTKKQFERFTNVLDFVENMEYSIPLKHISNSAAILQFPDANLDLVRPGISLFGVYPAEHMYGNLNLKPTITWKSRVVYFKVIKPGHPVGYGSEWQTNCNTRAVTVPVGYGDGYMKSMSHKAEVLIKGKRYPVVGSISMDQIVVNIENDSAFNGDEVILLGRDHDEEISCQDLSNWAGTVNYEILTNINTRVPRVYIEK